MKRALPAAVAVAVATLGLAPGARAASLYGTTPDCTGGAVPMGAQAWDITAGMDMAKHIHTEVCLPMLGTISKAVDVDVKTLMHDNDGTVTAVRWQDVGNTKQTIKMSWRPGVSLAASRIDTLRIDPAKFDASGWRELRITTDTTDPVKGRWYTTSRYCVFVVNGKARKDYCGGPTVQGRCGWAGWYGDYMNVYVDCRDYARALAGPLQAGDVLRVKFERDRGVASLDPDFHHGNLGRVLYDGPGKNAWRTITIPPGLSPGVHKLHLRTEYTRTTKPIGTFAGAGVLVFTIADPPSDPGGGDPVPQ